MNQKLWELLLYALPAIGVPAGLAVLIGKEVLLQRPWAALGLFLAYEAILAIGRFATDVGKELSKIGAARLDKDRKMTGMGRQDLIPEMKESMLA